MWTVIPSHGEPALDATPMPRDAKILLVDDNPDDVELTVRMFRVNRVANDIAIARDGDEALMYLRESQPLPEVVILDLKLPTLDGMDVLRAIRADERTRTLPVIVLTTSQQEDDFVRSLQLGASTLAQKPLAFTRFVEVASELGLRCVLLGAPSR